MDFELMKISFCERMADNVIKSDAKKYILDIIGKYDINIQNKYANILNEKNIKFLKLNPHLITIKTGGSNYYLFLTRINDVNCCFFIDRKIKQGYTYPRVISVKYRFDNSVFNDTLIDGELVKDKNNNWMFLINDLLIFKGEKLKCNIISKYNKLYKMLTDNYVYDENFDICPLMVKKIFTYKEYDTLITQFIPSLTYQIRGLYFNTLNTKHANFLFLSQNNNNKKIVKQSIRKKPQKNTHNIDENVDVIKPSKNNIYKADKTLDDVTKYVFELRKTTKPEIYDLYGLKNGEKIKYSVAHVPGLRASKKIKLFFKNTETPVVECLFIEKFKKYEPIKLSENSLSNI